MMAAILQTFQNKIRIRKAYYPYILISIRFLFVLWPQTGYIHPDEFFQSTEVIAGDVFDVDTYRSWEFNSSFPIRTIAIPFIFCGLPFLLLQTIIDSLDYPPLNAYILLILPRLAVTAFSVLIDVYLKRLCILFNREYTPVLLIFSTSYVTLAYLTRTLSNSIEAVLVAALVFHVTKSIDEITKTAEKAETVTSPYAVPISCLCVVGFFNRPTFLLFAFPPVMFWIQFGPRHRLIRKIRYRLNNLLPGFICTTLAFAVCDTAYYKGIPESPDQIFTLEYIDELVFTPVNFIKYNLETGNLVQHGLHPYWLHVAINIPFLFGYLGVIGLVKYWNLLYEILRYGMARVHIIHSLMTTSFIFPVLLLSVVEHQEARFLIPAIFPLVFLHGKKVWGTKWNSTSRICWLAYNAILFIFYGFVHQSGVVRCAIDIKRYAHMPNIYSEIHFVFFHTYMPPRHLFLLPFLSVGTQVVDLAGANFSVLQDLYTDIFYYDQHAEVYTMMPTSLSLQMPINLNKKFKIDLVEQYKPHFTFEDLPIIHYLRNESFWYQVFQDFNSQLSLDVYHLYVE